MTPGRIVVYDDGRLLHSAQLVSLKDGSALIRVFQTARKDKLVRVPLTSLTLAHERNGKGPA